jgi:hypothetical protein
MQIEILKGKHAYRTYYCLQIGGATAYIRVKRGSVTGALEAEEVRHYHLLPDDIEWRAIVLWNDNPDGD